MRVRVPGGSGDGAGRPRPGGPGWRPARRQSPGRQDQDIRFAAGNHFVGPPAQVIHRLFQAGTAVGGLEQDRQGDGFKVRPVNEAQLGQFFVGQDGVFSLTWRQFSGLGSSRFRSAPIMTPYR